MSEHVRLLDVSKIESIKATLTTDDIACSTGVMVSFASRGTHHPLLIVPMKNVTHVGFDKRYPGTTTQETWFYVVLFEYGFSYPFVFGHLNPHYVARKLNIEHYGTAVDITVFLNALGASKSVYAYLGSQPITGDCINEKEYNADV